MPGSVEAALLLIVLAGPGFVASRLLNSLVPYRTPTTFQETTQAIVFSAVMVPAWLLFAKPLLASRNEMLAVWNQRQEATQLPGWAIWMPILIFGLVYFVVAPCVATIWAIFIRKRPHVRAAQAILGVAGVTIRSEEGPEVWDDLFVQDEQQRWVRVTFKDGTAIEGCLMSAGVSPASRQVHLSGLTGVANSLTLLDATGAVVRDLNAQDVAAIWIEINSEVRRVDVYRS
jgi:hypothetical protein